MKFKFFIMIYAQSEQSAFPMLDENDEVKFYLTESEARKVAEDHYFASRVGYEIFEMGTGE